LYIPDPTGHQPTHRIHNTMDKSVSLKIEKCCSQCHNYDYTYNKCPMNEQPATVEVWPSGNPCYERPHKFLWQQEEDVSHWLFFNDFDDRHPRTNRSRMLLASYSSCNHYQEPTHTCPTKDTTTTTDTATAIPNPSGVASTGPQTRLTLVLP
jgi:hypothetical protein